jgi:polyisoprenoid-binding protein YceI
MGQERLCILARSPAAEATGGTGGHRRLEGERRDRTGATRADTHQAPSGRIEREGPGPVAPRGSGKSPPLLLLLLGVLCLGSAGCVFDSGGVGPPYWSCQSELWECPRVTVAPNVSLSGSSVYPQVASYKLLPDLWANPKRAYQVYWDQATFLYDLGHEQLKGSMLIMTGAEDSWVAAPAFLRIGFRNDVEQLYVAYDSRANPKPSWLSQDYVKEIGPDGLPALLTVTRPSPGRGSSWRSDPREARGRCLGGARGRRPGRPLEPARTGQSRAAQGCPEAVAGGSGAARRAARLTDGSRIGGFQMKAKAFLLGAALAVLQPPLPATGSLAVYKADASHSSVDFSIRHLTSTVSGRFEDFVATIRLDRDDPARSSVDFKILATSIDTADADRDLHLRSGDFFDAQQFPALSFSSTQVIPKDATNLEVRGDLTIRGVTRKVTVPVKLLGFVGGAAGEKAGFESTFVLDRRDFGIDWNRVLEAGPMLGDKVTVQILLEAKRTEMPELVPYQPPVSAPAHPSSPAPVGGAIRVRCTAQPHAIASGAQALISVLAYAGTNAPIPGANVLVESGGGWFSSSGGTTALGQTDTGGVFKTSWRAPSPAASAYQISVRVTRDGFTEGRGECLIPIQ